MPCDFSEGRTSLVMNPTPWRNDDEFDLETIMIPAPDHAEFLESPIGRCAVGRTFVIWCGAPDLSGIILWGEPDDQDVRDLVALSEYIHHPSMAPERCAILDCRDVQRVDADTLLGFTTAARDRMPVWSSRISRQAVLLPSGLGGILIAGALTSVTPMHPMRVVRGLPQALAFIDHPSGHSSQTAATEIANAARGSSVLVTRVRARLALDLVETGVDDCAAALGLSARTLQRELQRLGTSFSDELRRARVAAAEELLRMSDLKIESIASRVGFGTASRMSAVLRRELSATAGMVRANASAMAMAQRAHHDEP